MLLFSPGARQLINVAVDQLGDPKRKETWQRWATDHPRVRRAGDPWDDGGEPLPPEIVAIALLALNEMTGRKRAEREAATSEDEIATLDNYLSHVKAVIRLLTEGPPVRQAVPA